MGDTELGGKWKAAVSKNNKPTKAAIQKYVLDKSTVLGVGHNSSDDMLLLRGLRSKFCSHSYKFGDDLKKDTIKQPLTDIMTYRQEKKDVEYSLREQDCKLSKRVAQCTVDFELFTADKEI